MSRKYALMIVAALLAGLSACSGDIDDLRKQIADIKAQPGARIDPLPPIKPYDAFVYKAADLRSPFTQSAPARSDLANSVRPDSKRAREFLEQFSLDTLKMVGTLELMGKNYGLVQGKDGLVHRVLPGNHMGQNDGRIVSISSTKIAVVEIIPDGLGGYIERPAALALNE